MGHKTCGTCSVVKPLDQFGKRAKNKDGYNTKCTECKRKYDTERYARFSWEQKGVIKDIKKRRILEIKKYLYEYLVNNNCVDCGENRIATLDFDHMRDKSFNLGNAANLGVSMTKLKSEIEKCEVRCSNCHRIKTATQFNWYINFT